MLFQIQTTPGGQIQNVFQVLQAWGFADALLPFILIFVIIFAILQKVGLFKDEQDQPDRKINGVIAFVISALIIIPHITRTYPINQDPIIIINTFLPSTAILILAIFMVMLLLGLIGGKIPSPLLTLIGFASLIILGLVIIKAAFPAFVPRWTLDPNTQALIIVLLTMGLVGWFIIRQPEESKKSILEKLQELIG